MHNWPYKQSSFLSSFWAPSWINAMSSTAVSKLEMQQQQKQNSSSASEAAFEDWMQEEAPEVQRSLYTSS
jgi:hypothetical protein